MQYANGQKLKRAWLCAIVTVSSYVLLNANRLFSIRFGYAHSLLYVVKKQMIVFLVNQMRHIRAIS